MSKIEYSIHNYILLNRNVYAKNSFFSSYGKEDETTLLLDATKFSTLVLY